MVHYKDKLIDEFYGTALETNGKVCFLIARAYCKRHSNPIIIRNSKAKIICTVLIS